jgi:ATP-dependent helicase/nuclease subunit B
LFRLPNELSEHLLRGGTLIVPTPQRARAVQLAYAAAQLARGLATWASADVLSLSGWLRRETERAAVTDPAQWPRLLSPAEEWYLWREATAAAVGDFELLDAVRLGPSLRRAAALAAEHAIALRELPGDAEATLLARAQRLFAARCRALNAAPVAELTGALVERARHGQPPWLRGFDALPPRLRELGTARAYSPGTVAQVHRPATAEEELEGIAGWCVSRIRAQPDARLLVMLPGSAGPRERLAALIREALDPASLYDPARRPDELVGIEGGVPLGEAPLIAHALFSLRLLGGEELDFDSVAGWLRAPYWHSPAATHRAALAVLSREHPVARLDVRELLGALQRAPPRLSGAARDLAARLAQAQAAVAGAAASPRTWAERYATALSALGLSAGPQADSAAQQTLVRWHELLEEFGDLSACVPRLAGGPGIALLREFASGAAFRPADADVSVTISATLADPVVVYDGIWVAGLSAQVLPQPVHPDPFLPLNAQLAAAVPAASAAAREAQAQALLRSWQAGCAQLVLSVPVRAQDLELLPSPLLGGLAALPQLLTHPWLPATVHRPGQTELIADLCGDAWDTTESVPGGTKAVTLQSQCGFRAYAELRLGAAPPEAAEPGIAPDQRGRLLHTALQILWERLKDSRTLAAHSPAALDERIAASVAQAARVMLALEAGRRRRGRRAAEGQFDLFVQLPAVLERECRRAEGLIRRLCALELTRAPFTVVGTEHKVQLELAGARVHMRLDRVDELQQGRAILDYKSGRVKSPDWYGERPTHPQLLAYLAALGEQVVALATVHVNAREVCFSGVAAAEDLLPKLKAPRPGAAPWAQQQRQWRALIERLLREFIAGAAPVDPAPGACTYCHVTDICRILEHTARPESVVGDEDE